MVAEIPWEALWGQRSKLSFTAVGGAIQELQPAQRRGPVDTHHQGTVGVNGPADRQGVHILWEQGLMGECVTDASII